MSGNPVRVSGLQRQVLAFYRTVVRQARKQPKAEQRSTIAAYARNEFERYRSASPKDYQLIEHLLRKGKRQLQMLEDGSVTGVQLQASHR